VAARLPSWALSAADDGEPNSYWNPGQVRLSPAQLAELPAIVERARVATTGGVNGEQAAAFQDSLLKIAVRVTPSAGRAEVLGWAVGIIDSLQRFPPDLVAAAIAEARTTQFEFLNQVGPFIGRICEERQARRLRVFNRLRQIGGQGQQRSSAYVPIGMTAPVRAA
jgi:hypothetical protein